jgi:hypothetical protein
VIEVEDALDALYAVSGTVALHGLHARRIHGDAVFASVPLAGSDWILEDVDGYGLVAQGADVAIADSVMRRSRGLRAEDTRLTLTDVHVEESGATEAVVTVERGTLTAERLRLSDVPEIGLLLEDSGGWLTDVWMSGASRPVVQRACSGTLPPFEVTGLTCEGCLNDVIERCEAGSP